MNKTVKVIIIISIVGTLTYFVLKTFVPTALASLVGGANAKANANKDVEIPGTGLKFGEFTQQLVTIGLQDLDNYQAAMGALSNKDAQLNSADYEPYFGQVNLMFMKGIADGTKGKKTFGTAVAMGGPDSDGHTIPSTEPLKNDTWTQNAWAYTKLFVIPAYFKQLKDSFSWGKMVELNTTDPGYLSDEIEQLPTLATGTTPDDVVKFLQTNNLI